MAPTDAEWRARRVCVDAVALRRGGVAVSDQSSAECNCLGVRSNWIGHVEVEVDLLRGAIGPFGRSVVGGQLHPDSPAAVGVEDTVETLVAGVDPSAEEPRPERTLACDIGCIEHDDVTHNLHCHIFAPSFPLVGRVTGWRRRSVRR
jgi:hypothetical protein